MGGGFAPPPMVSPGALKAPAPAAGSRILVGFLVTFHNEPAGTFWPIYSGRLQLGRQGGQGADVGLADASASARHASIVADPTTGQAFVEDDGSRNGTYVNEQRLNSGEQRQLRDNDRVRIGSTTMVVKLLVA
jgi:pSer/pThr/pTyr-binding forkhead associated (FHA) protein